MAHTFDTKTNLVRNRSTSGRDLLITPAAGVTLLTLGITTDGLTARTGGAPTMNGNAMSQASTNAQAASGETDNELWYYLDPPTGSQITIHIPDDNNVYFTAEASTFKAGAGKSSALRMANKATGTSTNPAGATLTGLASTDVVVAQIGSGALTWAPSGRTGTQLYDVDDGSYGDGGQYLLTPSSSQAMNWTFGTSDDWAIVSAAFMEITPPAVLAGAAAAQTALSATGFTSSLPLLGSAAGQVAAIADLKTGQPLAAAAAATSAAAGAVAVGTAFGGAASAEGAAAADVSISAVRLYYIGYLDGTAPTGPEIVSGMAWGAAIAAGNAAAIATDGEQSFTEVLGLAPGDYRCAFVANDGGSGYSNVAVSSVETVTAGAAELAAAAAAVAGASGAIATAMPLTGTALVISGAVGAMTQSTPISAVAAATAQAAGGITLVSQLSGQALVEAFGAAAVATAQSIAGAAVAGTAAIGDLITGVPPVGLAGAAVAQALAAGDMHMLTGLVGTAAAQALVQAQISVSVTFSGQSLAQASAHATDLAISPGVSFAGVAQAQAGAVGAIIIAMPLTAAMLVSAAAGADLTMTVAFSGAAIGEVLATGEIIFVPLTVEANERNRFILPTRLRRVMLPANDREFVLPVRVRRMAA